MTSTSEAPRRAASDGMREDGVGRLGYAGCHTYVDRFPSPYAMQLLRWQNGDTLNMAVDLKTSRIDPDSETGRLLDEVTDRVFVLDHDGVRFIVSRIVHEVIASELTVIEDDNIWRPHDPERVRATLDTIIGA